MNPRRPTPSGPERSGDNVHDDPVKALVNLKVHGFLRKRVGRPLTEKLEEEFMSWCLTSASEKVCKEYIRKLREIDSGEKLVESSRWHITAYKKLMRYLCEVKGVRKACHEFNRVKSRKSNTDLWVPNDDEMAHSIETACRHDFRLCWYYKILLYTGLRSVEVSKALEKAEWKMEDGIWLQTLQLYRGSKNAFLAFSIEKPPKISVRPDWVSRKAKKLGIVAPKYVRKFVSTKMIALGVQEIVVDFIQGRTPSTVLRQRYVFLREIAKREYRSKYAEWLKGFLSSIGANLNHNMEEYS
ncbi:MAG: hypothetical protein F7B19_06640 [Desulfurococcales archaeon]|nr:hypothetical protein [Desulfurococcales archaeon]